MFPWRGTVDQKYCFCPTLAAPLTLTLRPTSARNAFARKGSRRPMFFIARTHTSPQHARSEHPSHFNTACKDEFFREISSISQLKSEGDYGGAGGGGRGLEVRCILSKSYFCVHRVCGEVGTGRGPFGDSICRCTAAGRSVFFCVCVFFLINTDRGAPTIVVFS